MSEKEMEPSRYKSSDETNTVLVDTLLFGEAIITYREGWVSARFGSESESVVTIKRIGQASRKGVPIGTREAHHVVADLSGHPLTLDVGKARFFKKTYQVSIEYGEHIITLAARDMESSIVLLGKTDQGDNCCATVTRLVGGRIDILWSAPFKFGGKIIEPPLPSKDNVLIILAIAAAFGTGGLSFTSIVMGIIGSTFP
ncbi:MAG: hypothetical protein ACRCSF_10650 [Mycobacteriaceae bacterium]